MRTAWHAMVGVVLSGQRRFVPRASTTVNYKFAALGAMNGGASRKQDVEVTALSTREAASMATYPMERLRLARLAASHRGVSHSIRSPSEKMAVDDC
jgi:hypothetical protein